MGLEKEVEYEKLKNFWLCYRKWLMLFPLKLQRNNRQNALAVDSANERLENKALFSSRYGDETTAYYATAQFFLSVLGH